MFRIEYRISRRKGNYLTADFPEEKIAGSLYSKAYNLWKTSDGYLDVRIIRPGGKRAVHMFHGSHLKK